jgi:hypothetical protein
MNMTSSWPLVKNHMTSVWLRIGLYIYIVPALVNGKCVQNESLKGVVASLFVQWVILGIEIKKRNYKLIGFQWQYDLCGFLCNAYMQGSHE